MPVPSRYISLQAIVNVVDSHSPDANQPYAICSRCNFVLEKDGPITLPVYHWSEDGPLTPGSTVFCVGNLFFPPGDDEGHVAASMMWVMSMPQLETEVQPDDEDSPEEPKISYPPSSVFPIGVLKNAIGRSWFLEVGFYDRISKSQKVFNIEVSVPDTKRYENVKPPAVDRLVSIQGTLASVSTYEEIANIKLEPESPSAKFVTSAAPR
ncbi:hypothetical protein FRC08_014957 [Ceratobasidium sp. 394]|nr:hypothetical protein FRC08_014957 [Ceratobasidium sp. 394]KAG9088049.1 hypothetical protein FS749_002463 [Ceratobasidium sp. UAMH 11750]